MSALIQQERRENDSKRAQCECIRKALVRQERKKMNPREHNVSPLIQQKHNDSTQTQ